jgi:hypothetical protein
MVTSPVTVAFPATNAGVPAEVSLSIIGTTFNVTVK